MLISILSVSDEDLETLCAGEAEALAPGALDLMSDYLLSPLHLMCSLRNPNLSCIQFLCPVISFVGCPDLFASVCRNVSTVNQTRSCTPCRQLVTVGKTLPKTPLPCFVLERLIRLVINSSCSFTKSTIECVKYMLVMHPFLYRDCDGTTSPLNSVSVLLLLGLGLCPATFPPLASALCFCGSSFSLASLSSLLH